VSAPTSYPPPPEPPPARPSSSVSSAPAPRLSSPATATPVVGNALRNKTLLGIAPVIPQRSELPAATATPRASEPPRPSALRSEPPRAAQPARSTPAANNSLRKQTLLGIAPVVTPQRSQPPVAQAEPAAAQAEPPIAQAEPPADAKPSPPPADAAPRADAATAAEAKPAPSIAAIESGQVAAAEGIASNAPVTRDARPKSSRAPAPRVAPSVSLDTENLPELRARRPRWMLPLGVVAAIGLGVVGLRQLDRAPTPIVEALRSEVRAPAAAPPAKPATDDESDPDPALPAEPEPVPTKAEAGKAEAGKAEADEATAAKGAANKPGAVAAKPIAANQPAPADSTQAGDALDAAGPDNAPSAELKRVSIDSEPPGARMFWRGKEVGTTPFVLEIPSGERRSYELGRPGYVTRRVVIDGSKSEITIGLKPQADSPTGVAPRNQ
jgi:hypothetical protein